MIQRVQTVYLLLVILLFATMAFLPFAHFELGDEAAVFSSFVFSFENAELFPSRPSVAWGGVFFTLVNIVYALRIIFDYNNRRRQARGCTFLLLFTVLLWATMATYSAVFMFKSGASLMPSYAVAMPFVALIFIALAKKAILSDERLVRSAERLR